MRHTQRQPRTLRDVNRRFDESLLMRLISVAVESWRQHQRASWRTTHAKRLAKGHTECPGIVVELRPINVTLRELT